MTSLCEACEKDEFDTVEPCDNAESPYRLCRSCHIRLRGLSLRPFEWYNLAKRHGWWQFLLHDDFYDQEGKAWQPESEVASPELFPIPTLSDVSGDPESLLDFSITRYRLEDSIIEHWNSLESSVVLPVLSQRFAKSSNIGIRSCILEVAASALGNEGSEFIRYAWGEYPDAVDLMSLACASASCLPFEEGFDEVVRALEHCETRERLELMHSLAHFRSHKTLEWIEEKVSGQVTESWGNLAAASDFSWPLARKWLRHGRPLSLVALDALAAIIRPQTRLLQLFSPRLHDPPDLDAFKQSLSDYLAEDSAPRVIHRTDFILMNATRLSRIG